MVAVGLGRPVGIGMPVAGMAVEVEVAEVLPLLLLLIFAVACAL